MTNDATEARVLKVWNAANNKHLVRSLGEGLEDDINTFQANESEIGYGHLTDLGAAEWKGIGRRTAENYAPFFSQVQDDGDKISFRTTSVTRTQESANAMKDGLQDTAGDLNVQPKVTDDKNLLLHSGASSAGNAAIAKAEKASNVRAAAYDLLHGLYSKAYIDTLSDQVGAALDIYLLYSTAPGLGDQTSVTFEDYVPLADVKVLGYVVDTKNFYRYGPGVTGETSSYKSARPLLADFFSKLDSRLAGGHYAAVFRLAHGETTMPFEALVRVPRSASSVAKGSVFKYGSNPWRGAEAGRLAGNVEWTAYKNATDHILVTMRYNEQPVKFRSACTPTASAPYFYRVDTLKDCLG
jgi:hypothetical protein